MTVLVVEDDPRVRSFLRAALERATRVLEARDGEAAIEVLERHAPDTIALVLVDHVIPKRSGLDVLRETHRRWPWIPGVMMTGFGSEDLAVDAFRAGAYDYIRKPVGVDELLRIVDQVTRTRRTASPRSRLDAMAETLPTDATHPNLAKAIAFVREHFSEPIGLSDVARAANLSRFHLSRLFRQETGVLFRGYLRALRIERAKVLLANRRATVTEIAYSVGFNDASRFDKNFSRCVGMSPTEYRRSLLSEAGRRSQARPAMDGTD